MLKVISNIEAKSIIEQNFDSLAGIYNKSTAEHSKESSIISISDCLYSKLASDVKASEGVPAFDRSTMDGYAVKASDTFGCSDAIPAILNLAGSIKMGTKPGKEIKNNECMKIATGGMLPKGADAVVMQEYTETHNKNIEVNKPVSPGENVIFKHDDIKPQQVLLKAGQILLPHHIGTLASLGISELKAYKSTPDAKNTSKNTNAPKVAIISTGDELINIGETPKLGQIRDVNSYILEACVKMCGCQPVLYGIIKDEYDTLKSTLKDAIDKCDCILISGGSSVGSRDNTLKVLDECGEILFHGLSIKPGKPTILAKLNANKKQIASFGLPGHPVASYFVFLDIVAGHLCKNFTTQKKELKIDKAISSNHGRTEFVPAKIKTVDKLKIASPIFIKSGLISLLSDSDGYIIIDKDTEGAKTNSLVEYTS